MKKILSLIVLLCLFLGLSVNAQDITNLSTCTDAQMAEVNTTFSNFTAESQQVGTASDAKTIVIGLDRIQRQWWEETYQALPKCTQAAEFGIKMGRVLDESMLALLLDAAKGDLGDDLSSPHTQVASGLLNEIKTLLNTPSTSSNSTNVTTTTYYVSGTRPVNIRACASTTCKIVSTAQSGTALKISDDSGDWYKVELDNGESGFVSSSIVSSSRPVVRPTKQVVYTPIPIPTQPIVVQSPSGDTCPNLSATCSQLTCQQAYACLAAGNGSLDQDNDGIPCESICGGG